MPGENLGPNASNLNKTTIQMIKDKNLPYKPYITREVDPLRFLLLDPFRRCQLFRISVIVKCSDT